MKKHLQKRAVKFTLTLITSIIVLVQSTKGQSQNALSYKGVDDKVIVPGASSVIANSTGMTLSCWVYPRNNATTWPDFDAFAGFRNDADADFYLVQVSSTNVECRLRVSGGASFDITDNNLVLNTWQHYVCTYDGLNLKTYYNGVLTQTAAASGSITDGTVDLYIGDQLYGITHFFLDGQMDEVALWNRALSAQEVNCAYNGSIDTSDANLKLYYKFNQGVAGGSNTGVTTLIDSKGTLNGTLSSFALSGATSNWVTSSIASSLNVSAGICTGESYVFGSQILTTSGIYTDTLASASGCDSIVTLTLTVASVDTSVNLFSTVLHSNQAGATYQWVNCNTGYSIITGAIAQNYIVTAAGNYAVIVSKDGCTDTSACHNVTFAGIQENNIANYIHIYPNPVADNLTINLDQQLHDANIQITDVEGRILWSEQNNKNAQLKINVSAWSAGIYILKVTSANGIATLKINKK